MIDQIMMLNIRQLELIKAVAEWYDEYNSGGNSSNMTNLAIVSSNLSMAWKQLVIDYENVKKNKL